MSKPFKPFVTIPSASAPSGPQPFQAVAAHEPHASAQPTITLKRDGDQITHIMVQCACGQTIELTCQY
jgi:hypothetical protein